MSGQVDYLRRLREVVARVSDELTSEERADVDRLIDHDEGGEAMLTLAWILAEEGRRIPASAIREIRELADGLIDPADFPADLDRCGIPDT